MELLDIYTADKRLTGKTMERHQDRNSLKEGEYFLFEQAWILNSKKEILLSRRAKNKKYAGMWEPTSGHVKSKETSLDGIKREVKEELGIDVNDTEIKLVKTFLDKKSINEVWIINKEILLEDIKFLDHEVSEVKFVTLDEFKNMLKNNETFNNLKYFIDLYESL